MIFFGVFRFHRSFLLIFFIPKKMFKSTTEIKLSWYSFVNLIFVVWERELKNERLIIARYDQIFSTFWLSLKEIFAANGKLFKIFMKIFKKKNRNISKYPASSWRDLCTRSVTSLSILHEKLNVFFLLSF